MIDAQHNAGPEISLARNSSPRQPGDPLPKLIVWLHGPFGVGKTTTAQALRHERPDLRGFDPEHVGYLLRLELAGLTVADFQDWASWRRLVPAFADEVATESGQPLLAVQSVLVEQYWQELRTGLASREFRIVSVLLDADPEALHARIDADPDGVEIRAWRHDHVEPYLRAREWLVPEADLVIDTARASAVEAAQTVRDFLASLGLGLEG